MAHANLAVKTVAETVLIAAFKVVEAGGAFSPVWARASGKVLTILAVGAACSPWAGIGSTGATMWVVGAGRALAAVAGAFAA